MISNLNFGSSVNMMNTSPDLPAGSSSTSVSNGCFSIYSQDIRFEQDYTSNYSFENTRFMKDQTSAQHCYMDKSSVLVCPVMQKQQFCKPDNNNEIKQFNHNLSTKQTSTSTSTRNPTPFIDNLHNYSKPCFEEHSSLPYKYEEDEEDDEDEDEQVDIDSEQAFSEDETNLKTISLVTVEEKLAPDHHARRPMNAFLIFCKRHRGIVREKYPNLENRAITKILGDWWANMDDSEKSCFTNLAKEYKDAFFNANPTFQWYKLPAPPLRSLTTGPPADHQHTTYTFCNDQLPTRSYSQQHSIEIESPRVDMFKLADETQMGGLNSLMGDIDSSVNVSSSGNSCKNIENNLQRTLDESRSFFANSIHSTIRTKSRSECPVTTSGTAKRKRGIGESNVSSKRWSCNETIVTSPQVDFERFVQENLAITTENIIESDFTDNYHHHITSHLEQQKDKKTTRACKGKRYLEFINTVKVNSLMKRTTNAGPQKQPTARTSTKVEYDVYNQVYATPLDNNKLKNISEYREIRCQLDEPTTTSVTTAKQFNAKDFDLDDKINALVALDLEQYLSRKRDNKKKKKINTKRTVVARQSKIDQKKRCSPQTIQEAKDHLRRAIVGSQKRKARKESITRRDIAAAIKLHPFESLSTGPLMLQEAAAPSDLFILAEVASAVNI